MPRKIPYAEPDPAGSERARIAKKTRDLATEVSRLRPQALTRSNGEEADHGGIGKADDRCVDHHYHGHKDAHCKGDEGDHNRYPANFTKGLTHDAYGLLENPRHYHEFVEAINSADRTLFDKHITTGEAKVSKERDWRGWESPRSGHVYELEGPDAGSVGMAPAPRISSSELAFEMAEVYSLALLRDVPFETIRAGGAARLCEESSDAELSADAIVKALGSMPFMTLGDVESSTPPQVDESGLNRFERNRRDARLIDGPLSAETVFRGSTPGAMRGPYISQFMLIGTNSIAGAGGGGAGFPGKDSAFDPQDGFIPYGSLIIDQRTISHRSCLDHMTDWCSWLDVQQGADRRGEDTFEATRRFITTPRDLATYVHYDALYEAYLNACLVLLSLGTPASKGFPEPSISGRRGAFATFGGPHILSLVTEVATRCLKGVRRQKFNYHRRARPEATAQRLALLANGQGIRLGNAQAAYQNALDEIPDVLLKAIASHNDAQNTAHGRDPGACLPKGITKAKFVKHNLLLPMAFPEGSPMHPSYGAGHATVAGGCVTMLKAFFEMFTDHDSGIERPLLLPGGTHVYVPNAAGDRLVADKSSKEPLTIQGELDKLAANISIGRNMAGVHYYSDYYDSLRMGERIAVGILLEQAPTYGDYVESTFTSFDGDQIILSGEGGSCPSLSVLDRDGNQVSPDDWWLRHVSGREMSEDN